MNSRLKMEMKDEAVNRMRMLGLDNGIIDDFAVNGELRCSNFGEITDVPADALKEIEEWENKFHNLVYHVIHANFWYETYECLSVSCYKEDWGYENGIIRTNWVMSHSINKNKPEYTESGSIKVVNNNGMLKRVN